MTRTTAGSPCQRPGIRSLDAAEGRRGPLRLTGTSRLKRSIDIEDQEIVGHQFGEMPGLKIEMRSLSAVNPMHQNGLPQDPKLWFGKGKVWPATFCVEPASAPLRNDNHATQLSLCHPTDVLPGRLAFASTK
jgi:hypothetical protein